MKVTSLEKLQLNSIALEQANVCNLYSSLFFLPLKNCIYPFSCEEPDLSYFLFLVCTWLMFKSPPEAGQEWDKEEVTRGVSQLRDVSQVLEGKKESSLYMLFHTSDLLSSICRILRSTNIFRKLCENVFVSHCFVNSLNMRKASLYLLVLKKRNFVLQKELYMLIKLMFLCFPWNCSTGFFLTYKVSPWTNLETFHSLFNCQKRCS